MPDDATPPSYRTPADMLARRERLLGPNTPIFYDKPVHLVKGEGVWVVDADGKRYLDCYNNVPHVGHCHPQVVEAIAEQSATLNVHSRYLHDNLLDYAEQLLATFGDDLSCTLLTCTGSEANDVALRMAATATGNQGVIVTDHNYHGNTRAVMELATLLPHDLGAPAHMRTFPCPDSYHLEAGEKTLDDMAARVLAGLDQSIESLQKSGHGLAALLVCPIFANEGFPDLPTGFFAQVKKRVSTAGGVIIADEVQSGFGRCGSDMWGHQYGRFAPDIVTLGKPMGNGYPVAGVVCREDIMHSFRHRTAYFNTFGANPVACAAASATLQVVQNENLPDNALQSGQYMQQKLRALAEHYTVLGDVRGAGLFLGAEIVKSQHSREPDAAVGRKLINAMREEGVLMGLIGRYDNLLKIRPPMPFNRDHADHLFQVLESVLERLAP